VPHIGLSTQTERDEDIIGGESHILSTFSLKRDQAGKGRSHEKDYPKDGGKVSFRKHHGE